MCFFRGRKPAYYLREESTTAAGRPTGTDRSFLSLAVSLVLFWCAPRMGAWSLYARVFPRNQAVRAACLMSGSSNDTGPSLLSALRTRSRRTALDDESLALTGSDGKRGNSVGLGVGGLHTPFHLDDRPRRTLRAIKADRTPCERHVTVGRRECRSHARGAYSHVVRPQLGWDGS